MIDQLKKISKARNPKQSLLDSVSVISTEFAPHRLAHMLAQVMHESGGLVYDREIWGPTEAQKRYEGRKDLGNTIPGDGSKFRGYGPLQVTGRANVDAFHKWCVVKGLNPPDFVQTPSLIAESPWAGWSIVWYWDLRDLNRFADSNDIEMITRKVNGGLNGYDDRLSYYDRSALVLLGYEPTDIGGFQAAQGLKVDGISGPKTRAALHGELVKGGTKDETKDTRAAPVVALPASLEKPWYKTKEVVAPVIAGGGLTAGVSFMDSLGRLPWQNMLVLGGFVFAGLIGYLLWSRARDKRKVNQP